MLLKNNFLPKRAIELFTFFKNNPQKLQEILIPIFKNRNLKIKELTLFKKHWIIKNQWKISASVNLENNVPEKILLEIHDNVFCFKRAIFALTTLAKIIAQPIIFEKINRPKIIVREFVKGDNFYKLISEKKLSLNEILEINKKISIILASLHSLKLSLLPKFLFKKVNKEMEEKTLKKTFKFITPEIKVLRKKFKTNLRVLFKKMNDLDRKNKISLIHSDPNLSHFIINDGDVYLVDSDGYEIGNPAKDLGKFIFDLKYYLRGKYSLDKIESIVNSFLENYLKKKSLVLKPNLKINLNVHQAERAAYIILSKIWGKKTLIKKEVHEIEKLLTVQEKLLNL